MNLPKSIAAFVLILVFADDSFADETAKGSAGALSHEFLFAPNKTYPYFEQHNQLYHAPEPTYDLRNAAMLAQCSYLVYVKDRDFLRETLAKTDFKEVSFFEREGTFAFLAESDADLLLVFRGTESADKIDFLTDAKIIQNDFGPKGRAHSGFIEALSWVSDDIAQVVENKPEAKRHRVWVAGHSLGGALATLWGIQNSDRVISVYTIGTPRIGGTKLADYWDERLPLYRTVNDNDIIPRIPTPPFYKHIGSTYFVTTDKELIVDPPALDKWEHHLRGHREFLNRLFKEHWSESDFTAIPSDYLIDHSPRLYTEALLLLATSVVNGEPERKSEKDD